MKGWADSILRNKNARIHYYKNGISLCKRSTVDSGMKHFDDTPRNESDIRSYHCKICIEKYINNE